MEGIGWWEGIHRIPAGVNSTLDCVPQLPNEAILGPLMGRISSVGLGRDVKGHGLVQIVSSFCSKRSVKLHQIGYGHKRGTLSSSLKSQVHVLTNLAISKEKQVHMVPDDPFNGHVPFHLCQ
jgi:hypothetical protein